MAMSRAICGHGHHVTMALAPCAINARNARVDSARHASRVSHARARLARVQPRYAVAARFAHSAANGTLPYPARSLEPKPGCHPPRLVVTYTTTILGLY